MCLGFSLIVLGFFFPPTLGFLKSLFFPPVNPTTQQQSEQTGRKEDCSSETCVHTHRATTCLHHHGGLHPFWMELCRMGKEGRLDFFFYPLFFLLFFNLSKEGTKSQPSFKPTAAWEPSTSQKATVSMWEPSPHLSPSCSESVLSFERYRSGRRPCPRFVHC